MTRVGVVNRTGPGAVALETTLLIHGVPRSESLGLASRLFEAVRAGGAAPALVGVVAGVPTAGMTDAELRTLLDAGDVPKANTANLGVLMHRKSHAATTVSATMEIAAAAGLMWFATGGLGGVHKGFGERLDISSDLAAFTRFPVAVVTSGVKSILDVESTREALETLGVTVAGFRTDSFPAFYRRGSAGGGTGVDARFDDERELAAFVRAEMARTGRGLVVANPIPAEHEIGEREWAGWLGEAERRAAGAGVTGRGVTPFILGALHEVSGGATLRANLALVEANAALAGRLAVS